MFENSALQPVLPVSDIERAKAWYADKLGLEPIIEDGQREMAVYQHAGSMFLLYRTDNAGTNKATAAGFLVGNFDEVVSELRARGVSFDDVDFGEGGKTIDGVITSPDGSEKGAWFADSEGNIIGLSTMPPG